MSRAAWPRLLLPLACFVLAGCKQEAETPPATPLAPGYQAPTAATPTPVDHTPRAGHAHATDSGEGDRLLFRYPVDSRSDR